MINPETYIFKFGKPVRRCGAPKVSIKGSSYRDLRRLNSFEVNERLSWYHDNLASFNLPDAEIQALRADIKAVNTARRIASDERKYYKSR